MKQRKTILIADANSGYCSYLERELNLQPDMEVVSVATNGVDTVRQIEAYVPDVVLMDVVLPGLDGIGVLRSLGQLGLETPPLIFVMTCFATERMETLIAALGAQYLLIKPFEIASLVELLRDEAELEAEAYSAPVYHPCDEMEQITDMLLDMGIPTHIKGFPYTREAIILTLNAQGENTGITKFIYPQVAKKYSTTAARVERAIRHAIELAWVRGDNHAHYRLFRNSVCGNRGKPTNSEFISTLAEKLALREYTAHPTSSTDQLNRS